MRVLHVVGGLGMGGAESQVLALLEHTRHDADVITLHAGVHRAIFGDSAQSLGVRRPMDVRALRRLWRQARSGGYDVIHTHRAQAAVYGRLAARFARPAIAVTSLHSNADYPLRHGTLGRRWDALIAVSDAVARTPQGRDRRKLTVIPNGADFDALAFDPQARSRVREELGLPNDAAVLGTVGRLDPVKRTDLLLAASAPLLSEDVKLLLVGDGPERAHLIRLARAHGVAEHVLFAGERTDVGAVLSAMDMFVAPSAAEGFGLSIVEALANGLPVLYTECPALVGVATDRARQVPGERGALRHEIRKELAARRGRAPVPQRLRDGYDIADVAARTDDLYVRLWTRRTGRPLLAAGERPAVGAGDVRAG